MRRGPARELELGVPGLVPVRRPVAILVQHDAVGVDEQGAERLVPGVERFPGQLDAPAQVGQVGFREVAHAPDPRALGAVCQERANLTAP